MYSIIFSAIYMIYKLCSLHKNFKIPINNPAKLHIKRYFEVKILNTKFKYISTVKVSC